MRQFWLGFEKRAQEEIEKIPEYSRTVPMKSARLDQITVEFDKSRWE